MERGTPINRNYSDASQHSGTIQLNSSTSVKIADANPERIYFYVVNDNPANAVHIKLKPASVDNNKDGIVLSSGPGGRSFWEMPERSIQTGEICAIAVVDGPSVHVVEF